MPRSLVRIGNAYLHGTWSVSGTVAGVKHSKRRSHRLASILDGLPDVHGECVGIVSETSLRRLNVCGAKPVRLSLFTDGERIHGPAWIDLSIRSGLNGDAEVAATFVAAGVWSVTKRHA
jgi:hypothetical protein